jgi:formylglycine-generating enzyme required for sulfatase activity
VREPLLVDMFEVTRDQWLRFQNARPGRVDPDLEAFTSTWPSGTEQWPASYVRLDEAEDFARWRGMRLLTSSEWIYCAIGPQRLPYPWGATGQLSIANTLELQLDRPTPVGTFEAGRTSHDVYDLLGNVAEWTADLAPSRERWTGDGRVAAMGGSFRNHARPIFDPLPQEGQDEVLFRALAPGSRSDDIGVRCCVDAAAYLWAHADQFGGDESSRRRLIAIGRRWGGRALPLLGSLAARIDAPPALDALVEGARQ